MSSPASIDRPELVSRVQAKSKHLSMIKLTSVLHLLLGSISLILGAVAIEIRAFRSYFATPIWTGILIAGSTGVIGILAGFQRSQRIARGYVIVSGLSAATFLPIIVLYSLFATREIGETVGDHPIWVCEPKREPMYNCGESEVGRIVVDSLIAFTALCEVLVSCVSAYAGYSFGGFISFPRRAASGVLHMIFGLAMVILGGVAIGVLAYRSYFAVPIWSGILIYGTAGVVGILTATTGSPRVALGYVAMSVMAVLASIGTIVAFCFFATFEEGGFDDNGDRQWICRPGLKEDIANCGESEAGRIIVDSLIAFFALLELILSLVTTYLAYGYSQRALFPTAVMGFSNNSANIAAVNHGYKGDEEDHQVHQGEINPYFPAPGPSQS